MKEIPILMSTPMVQAILSGRKTLTRRTKGLFLINEEPDIYAYKKPLEQDNNIHVFARMFRGSWVETMHIKCPYGQPGDVLWVRETWNTLTSYVETPDYSVISVRDFVYKADDDRFDKWKPSIFMPKEACRIRLLVKDVRVERLQDISEYDAKDEGITDVEFYPDEGFPLSIGHMFGKDDGKAVLYNTRIKAYKSLWESINGNGSWDKNPWVWVIEFEK